MCMAQIRNPSVGSMSPRTAGKLVSTCWPRTQPRNNGKEFAKAKRFYQTDGAWPTQRFSAGGSLDECPAEALLRSGNFRLGDFQILEEQAGLSSFALSANVYGKTEQGFLLQGRICGERPCGIWQVLAN